MAHMPGSYSQTEHLNPKPKSSLCRKIRIAVKELNLSYCIEETL